jgi:hypothetical protein
MLYNSETIKKKVEYRCIKKHDEIFNKIFLSLFAYDINHFDTYFD